MEFSASSSALLQLSTHFLPAPQDLLYVEQLTKYDYIIVRTKSQLCWLNLPHLPILPPPVTIKHRVVMIPGDQPEEGTDGYGGKDFEKMKVLRDREELGDDEGSN